MSDQYPYGSNNSYGGSSPHDDPKVQHTALPSYQPTMPAMPGYGYPQAGAPGGVPPTPPGQLPVPVPGAGWQHGAAGAPGGTGATLMTIGDIAVTESGIVTPAGVLPLRGAVWTVSDMSRTESKTPTYAIVLAVIFFFACLLGLLFLLMKEQVTTGYAQVTVNSGGKYHAVMIPVRGPQDIYAITQQVNYARTLCS
ncbi:hypothetical protein [Actinacidiphila epipremni]|uniref:Uncharacterized protein n=1 Tax=Actinacidiphila epipremni TaxID=2053013 RepID=A0ABX0ZWI1_9ACTN|nr:hypothetical protein [Actinacidiphila epipremni]NJP47122.1 hypothetical protein [Actinacidiphila epipremni]